MQQAFEEHQRSVDELRKKRWRFAGRDIGSWIVVGTLELAAAIVDSPALTGALGVGGFAAKQILDAPRLRDMPAKWREFRREKASVHESATGLLFKHRR